MIYTSYFGNLRNLDKNNCIAICRWMPKWVTGIPQYLPVAPTESILDEWHIKQDIGLYIRRYQSEVLDTLNPQEIGRILDGKILLCYERPDQFCHRHLLAEWLKEHGIPCEEYIAQPTLF